MASEFYSGDVRQLVEMGFKPSLAVKALAQASDVGSAASLLIEGGIEDSEAEDDEAEEADPSVLPTPKSPSYISLSVTPARYPTSRSLRGLHPAFQLLDAPLFKPLSPSEVSDSEVRSDEVRNAFFFFPTLILMLSNFISFAIPFVLRSYRVTP